MGMKRMMTSTATFEQKDVGKRYRLVFMVVAEDGEEMRHAVSNEKFIAEPGVVEFTFSPPVDMGGLLGSGRNRRGRGVACRIRGASRGLHLYNGDEVVGSMVPVPIDDRVRYRALDRARRALPCVEGHGVLLARTGAQGDVGRSRRPLSADEEGHRLREAQPRAARAQGARWRLTQTSSARLAVLGAECRRGSGVTTSSTSAEGVPWLHNARRRAYRLRQEHS